METVKLLETTDDSLNGIISRDQFEQDLKTYRQNVKNNLLPLIWAKMDKNKHNNKYFMIAKCKNKEYSVTRDIIYDEFFNSSMVFKIKTKITIGLDHEFYLKIYDKDIYIQKLTCRFNKKLQKALTTGGKRIMLKGPIDMRERLLAQSYLRNYKKVVGDQYKITLGQSAYPKYFIYIDL